MTAETVRGDLRTWPHSSSKHKLILQPSISINLPLPNKYVKFKSIFQMLSFLPHSLPPFLYKENEATKWLLIVFTDQTYTEGLPKAETQ